MIPDKPGAISASWLSEVLGAPVEALRLLDTYAGTTGRPQPAAQSLTPGKWYSWPQ